MEVVFVVCYTMRMGKHFTWEEKVDNLTRIAKEVGIYLDVEVQEPGTDYCKAVRRRLMDAYEEFCQWRHEEPYVVDEIKALIEPEEYIDELTGVRMTIERDIPEHPRITVMCPEHTTLSIEQVNGALSRLRHRAKVAPAQLPDLVPVLPDKQGT